MTRTSDDWWTPKPMTEDDMKRELAFSRIKGQPHQEFSDEAISKTLKALNLSQDNVRQD